MSRGRMRAALVTVGGTATLLLAMPGVALAAEATAKVISPTSTVTATAQVKVSVDRGGGSLTITGPGGYSFAKSVGSASAAQEISCTFDPRANGCAGGGTTLPNGTYTVTAASKAYTTSSGCGLGGTQSCSYSASSSSQTFLLSAAPVRPTMVGADVTAFREITVTWEANPEPDLASYDLLNGSGDYLVNVIPGDVCSGTRCHVTVSFPDEDPGGKKEFAVRAYRADGAGKGEVLGSPMSATVGATLEAPPTTDPGSGGGSGGSTGGGTGGGSTGGGSTGGSGGTGGTGGGSGGVVTEPNDGTTTGSGGGSGGPGYSGYSGRPGLGLKFTTSGGGVALPTLPGGAGGNLKPQIPEGTYDPTLGYSDKVDLEKVRDETLSTRFVTTLSSAFTDTKRLFRSLAVALVLVLIGMHVRLWARTTSYE